MEAEESLAFARVRARKPASRPTSHSFIDIGLGEGRCTREVELMICWPSLYPQSSQFGYTVLCDENVSVLEVFSEFVVDQAIVVRGYSLCSYSTGASRSERSVFNVMLAKC